jgi:hypothetical protein
MVRVDAIPSLIELPDPGYASVYMFREEDALKIKTAQSSRNLAQYPVASEHLVIDIDDGDEGLAKVVKVLDEKNYSYEVWSSGGKGYHIYIPHDLVVSENLPYSHKKTIEELGLEVDESLYQHGRLLSLPNRVHPKTGKKKELIRIKEGEKMSLKLYTPPTTMTFNFEAVGGLDLYATALDRLKTLIAKPPKPGNRHTALWGVSKDLFEIGLSYETVLDLILKVNELWPDKKPKEEVEIALTQAMKSIGK